LCATNLIVFFCNYLGKGTNALDFTRQACSHVSLFTNVLVSFATLYTWTSVLTFNFGGLIRPRKNIGRNFVHFVQCFNSQLWRSNRA
jgi:hypothetical protein